MNKPLEIAYPTTSLASSVNKLDELVTRLEKVFGHDTTHAQKQAQYIAIWHENGDDDAYESIDWDFVIRVLSTHHE